MATNCTASALHDEPLSDADRAAIDRALAEPGITLSADKLAALLDAGGIARQAQLRHALGEDGYRAHQRALYQRAVEKHGATNMQAILTAAHEQRRCWRIANPTPAEELLHWSALEAGITLHLDLSGTWEWASYQAEPGDWQFGPSDAVVEARVRSYACDLLFPAHALVIEVVGGVHTLTAERDTIRTETLAGQGLAVITFTNAQVFAGEADRLFNHLLEVPHAA